MSKKELLYYLLENNTNISIAEIAIGIIMSVLLAFFIYVVYKKTYTGVMYSKNFNVTLLLITIITTMVMMIIGSNLALSLGMVGALSIIRFRTAVKDTKDSAYIFWAIAVGIACGSGIYTIAILGSIVIALILIFMNKGAFDDNTYLVIVHGTDNLDIDKVSEAVEKNCKKTNLKMKNVTSKSIDVTYEVSFVKGKDSDLVKDVKDIEGITAINVVTYNGEIAG
ncbi:MAG: DUF4956 domain-containing protein [Butyrivibrio sp.]|uniref:DUF4956 domain-containing protein n=1 Tax=Butyrivibrio sp. TaxID=28121 RepID=UPI001B233C1F|nr:DUF4956 domain-containing protein [Butyrivibrio sp.]MBO6239432.1 DUF4956 domain-containing protein [Butyrivibrio sp.]MBP3817034.1 DUF4956 domain-containing protein [Butyrivibrio sp.]